MHILYSDKVDTMQMKWERRKGMERAINRWKSKIALNTDKTSSKRWQRIKDIFTKI